MEQFPLFILIAAILHITEEFYYPGGFLNWTKKNVPRIADRMNIKIALIINGLFLLLCLAGVFLGGYYPKFALSIAGLILVNGTGHFFASVFTKSYSPGLITGLIFYIPLSIYIFTVFNLSASGVFVNILYGILYHLAVPILLFAPFNKLKTISWAVFTYNSSYAQIEMQPKQYKVKFKPQKFIFEFYWIYFKKLVNKGLM